ncbi:hypothetical protein B0H16DRAFT_1601327 [Mycena metata]|uniref:Uncharacterized protein n=1 Tax=Mycena metata TaxID=1033252 RepID=A0AAD7MKR4_9AGAR|nr:hypothetical protein B0H16DRAFT_1601327 [Mycena metata]
MVSSVKFSPDGTQIVSGSYNNALHRDIEPQPAAQPPTGDTDVPNTTLMSLNSSTTLPPIGRLPGFNPRFKDEWVLNTAGERMFWLPPSRRNGLYLPRNTLVICAQGTTKLDLRRFVHGTEWHKCFHG